MVTGVGYVSRCILFRHESICARKLSEACIVNFLKKYIRSREIKKLEGQIALDYSHTIQKFLSMPVISMLDTHLARVNEIQQKLTENQLKEDSVLVKSNRTLSFCNFHTQLDSYHPVSCAV